MASIMEEVKLNLFKKTKIGYKPLSGDPNKQLEIKVKNDVLYSKFLKYRFRLPDGARLERFSYNTEWVDNTYYEFTAHFGLNASVSSFITPMSIPANCDEKMLNADYKKLGRLIIKQSFGVPPEKIKEEKFVNLDCLHFSVLTDRICPNGNRLYVDEYLYSAPYCSIAFMAMCPEDEIYKLKGIFENFK